VTPEDAARRRGRTKTVFAVVAVTVLVCCFVPALIALMVPWRYWWDVPVVNITQCEIVEETPANSRVAHVKLEVTSWAWWDRTYLVLVNVVDSAGQRVGDDDYTFTVPARHKVTASRDVELPRAGGVKCEVGEVKRVD
jgi:hypothetical protein